MALGEHELLPYLSILLYLFAQSRSKLCCYSHKNFSNEKSKHTPISFKVRRAE
jgi:hypothetical protein